MNRKAILLTVYIFSLAVLLSFTGCQGGSGNPAANDYSAIPDNTASEGASSVTFQIVQPDSKTSIILSDTTSSKRYSSASRSSVTFKLMLVNIGNDSTPISTIIKTVPVDLDLGTAEITFNNIPACTCIGEIKITGGSINKQTEFHGAIDLVPGVNNVLKAAAKGSKLHQDIVASVIIEIVNSPILFAQALPNLTLEVADAISGLDTTSDNIYEEALAFYAKYVNVDIDIISDPVVPPAVIVFTASPTIDGNFYDGQNLELELNIPDTYNQVAKVEFFSDASNKLAEFVEPPYQLTISKISGTATYTALVIYQSGATKTLKKTVECLPLPPLLEDAVLKANYPSISFAYADIRAIMEDNTANIDSRMATFTSYFADDFVDMSGAASKVDLETTTKSRLERYAINSYEFYPISHIEMASAGSTGTDTIKVTTRVSFSVSKKPGAAGAIEIGVFPISPDPVIIWKLQPDSTWKIYQGYPYKRSEFGF